MVLHFAPTTAEEEELALALAISASLNTGKPGPTSRPQLAAGGGSGSSSFTHGSSRGGAGSPRVPAHPTALSPLLNTAQPPRFPTIPPATSTPLSGPQSPAARPSAPLYPPVPPYHAPQTSSPLLPQRSFTQQRPQAPPHQPPQPPHYAGLRPGLIHAPQGGPSSAAASASSSPSRSRWGHTGSSAPVSPKATAANPAAAAAAMAGAYRSGSSSPARPAPRPPAGSSAAPPPAQPPSARPLPPVGRSKSALGPGALLGSGAAGSGGSASGSLSGQHQQQQHRPALAPPPQLFSDPEACAGCGRGFGLFSALGVGGGSVTGMGRKWHADCFKCGFCSEPISSGRGSFSYQMHPGDPRPYHADCYKHVHHPMCTVCGTFIPAGPDGRIQFREGGFWKEKYCFTHAEADITRCCACSRLQRRGEEWAPLQDGRQLCLGCLGSVVLDTADAQPLYGEVMAFYRDEMRLPHPSKPPLLLVDGPTLNQHAATEGRDDSADAPMFHLRGLCVATVYTSIPSISRGAGGALRTVSTSLSPSAAVAAAGISVRCDVKCILQLYGLPRLLTGSIMAHELMHAWLRLAGCVGLPLKVEEGLCQLMACLWLDRQHELLKGNSEEQRLASFFAYQIRTDTSEVYGDGFREAMEAFQSHGLTAVIRNVQLYGRYT